MTEIIQAPSLTGTEMERLLDLMGGQEAYESWWRQTLAAEVEIRESRRAYALAADLIAEQRVDLASTYPTLFPES